MFKKTLFSLGVGLVWFLVFFTGTVWGLASDPGLPDTVWLEKVNSLNPSDTITYHISYWSDSKIKAFTIPIIFYNSSNLDITLDASTVVWGADISPFESKIKNVDNVNKKGNFAALYLMTPYWVEPGRHEVVSFSFISGPGWSPGVGVTVDTTFYPPASRIKFIDSLGVNYIPSVIVSGWVKGPAPICGDANNNGTVNVADMVYLSNYCFFGGPAPSNPAIADCDGYSSINIRDIAYLKEYIFDGGPAPNCNVTSEYVPLSEPTDSITFSPKILPALDSTVAVVLNYKNSTSIQALAFPLKVKIGNEIPTIDSMVFDGRIDSLTGMHAGTIDPVFGTINIGFWDTYDGFPPASDTLLTLYLSIPPESQDRSIQMDTLRLSPANSPIFIKTSDFSGVVPELVDFGISDEVREEQKGSLPNSFALFQNYPNPFNLSTKIEFALVHSGLVSLNIYDVQGRKVKTLVSQELSAGYKSIFWEGKDDLGKEVSSGVYFYTLKVGDFSETKKLVLLK
jgi:hypothetical protein